MQQNLERYKSRKLCLDRLTQAKTNEAISTGSDGRSGRIAENGDAYLILGEWWVIGYG